MQSNHMGSGPYTATGSQRPVSPACGEDLEYVAMLPRIVGRDDSEARSDGGDPTSVRAGCPTCAAVLPMSRPNG